MPPQDKPRPDKTFEEVIEEVGLYPREAFDFVRQGLDYTVHHVHGEATSPDQNRHVSGQQLCKGLREFALAQWGMLARTVLRRWNIVCTEDFGRIVFALVDSGLLQKTDEDNIEDFKHVYDFATAFEESYRIESKCIG